MSRFKKILKFFEEGDASTLKKKQHLLIGGIFVVVSGFLWVAQSGAKKASIAEPKLEKPKKVVVADLVDERETWISRLEENSKKMTQQALGLQKKNSILEMRLENLEKNMMSVAKEKGSQQHKTKDIIKSPSFQAGGNNLTATPQVSSVRKSFPSGAGSTTSTTPFKPLKKIGHFSIAGASDYNHARDYVVAGSHAKAVLTSALVVSTSVSTQGNPQPIQLRLSDQGSLPRGWKSHMKNAVLMGSCYGDLSSERAVCRLHSLSFMEPSGRAVSKPIEGWIFGEDGAAGLRGKVVDRAGKVVREAFIAGMLSGMSSFFKSSAQSGVFPTSPFGQTNALGTQDVLKSGAAQGASNALEKLADFSIKRAEQMSPVLVINPGRVVDVVFKKGFNLDPSKKSGGQSVKLAKGNSQQNQSLKGL